VPIPRRFDRRPPERDTTRINDRIRVPEVRLIDENGEQVGVVPTEQALERARDNDLDLVEIAPTAKPPVTRILDYSKYKYEQEQRRKAARKHQQQVTIREMKLRPKIATHDYETKKGHILRFLNQNDKVKITIMFRGREQAHPERGEALLRKLAAELGELATIEQQPNQEGRNMTMVLAPIKGTTATNRRGQQQQQPQQTSQPEPPAEPETPAQEPAAEEPAAEAPAQEPAAEEPAARSAGAERA
jgi:translation initiation factor IF-3